MPDDMARARTSALAPNVLTQNYSGDYGDFASFATHMRRLAADKSADLLLVYVFGEGLC